MGDIYPPTPALLIVAAFSRYPEALEWGAEKCQAHWGPIALRSPWFDFVETAYYEPTMGPGIKKGFWAFERLIDPGAMPQIKIDSNDWEAEYAALGRHPESRPLNLDPGYITMAKLVLASTKDHSHRIYLGQGIYGEITLNYKHRRWQDHESTFPNYRRPDYQAFFTECREYLRRTNWVQ